MANSLRNFTVIESNNIALGQSGVDYISDNATYTPPNGLVVVAITFIEDSVFASGTTVESTKFTSQSVAGSGSNADAFGTDSFPAGLSIYGRFTAIDLASGAAMLYLAP